jgi:hypothetical protein
VDINVSTLKRSGPLLKRKTFKCIIDSSNQNTRHGEKNELLSVTTVSFVSGSHIRPSSGVSKSAIGLPAMSHLSYEALHLPK